jgi:hypothetical protein
LSLDLKGLMQPKTADDIAIERVLMADMIENADPSAPEPAWKAEMRAKMLADKEQRALQYTRKRDLEYRRAKFKR